MPVLKWRKDESSEFVPVGTYIPTAEEIGARPDTWLPTAADVGAAPAPLKEDLTLYVSATGSDETGDGTEANPFRQVQKAIDSIPRDLGGKVAYVSIGAGTFEGFSFCGFGNGLLIIYGVGTTTVISSQVSCLYNDCHCRIENCNISCNSPILANSCLHLRISGCTLTTGAGIGINCYYSMMSVHSCTISNKDTAIRVLGSIVFSESCTGSGNSFAYYVGTSNHIGGLIILGSESINASSKFYKEGCGHIIQNNTFK